MKKTYWLMIILFCGMVIGAMITSGAKIAYVLDLPSLIMVLGTTLILSLCNFSFAEIIRFFRIARGKKDGSLEDVRNGIAYFAALSRYSVLSGIIGTFVGAISMLANLTDPGMIGFGAALSLLTFLYGIIMMVLVAIPLKLAMEKKLHSLEASK
jgi:flagellar motor component MotA